MSAWRNFQSIAVPPTPPGQTRPRFSLTSDILSFRRCSRQYGYFGNDGFVPAQAVQIFYGTIVHQVLDRCHRHYSGLMGSPPRTMPTDSDIDHYFGEVENALRSHGVRPASPAVAASAKRILKIFNTVEGPTLYPRVFDTEYRLESDQGQYVLRGVVDVLVAGAGAAADPSHMEIWDYKGTQMPDLSSQSLQDYVWQMCVYAELYRVRAGVYPARAVLYFLKELDLNPAPSSRPPRAVYEVTFTPAMIAAALAQFDTTAQSIMACQATRTWPNPAAAPGQETCDICDIRWNCPTASATYGPYPLRLPM
jgi:hypothetical protein